MTASPTKWSQHFGDLAGLGAAVLVVGLVVAGPVALRDRPRRRIAGFAAGTAVAALVLSGRNLWPSVSGWFTPSFSTVPVGAGRGPAGHDRRWWLGGAVVRGGAGPGDLAAAPATRRGGFAVPRRLPAPAPAARGAAGGRAGAAGRQPGPGRAGAPGQLHPGRRRGRHRCAGSRAGCSRCCRSSCAPAAGLLLARPGPDAGTGRAGAHRRHRWPPAARDRGRRPAAHRLVRPGRRAARAGDAARSWSPSPARCGWPTSCSWSSATTPGRCVARGAGSTVPTRPRWPPATRSATSRQLGPAGRDRGPARRRRPAGRPGAGRPRCPCPGCPGSPRWSTCCRRAARAVLDWPIAFQFPCLRPGRAAAGHRVAAGVAGGPAGRRGRTPGSPTGRPSAARSPGPGCW